MLYFVQYKDNYIERSQENFTMEVHDRSNRSVTSAFRRLQCHHGIWSEFLERIGKSSQHVRISAKTGLKLEPSLCDLRKGSISYLRYAFVAEVERCDPLNIFSTIKDWTFRNCEILSTVHRGFGDRESFDLPLTDEDPVREDGGISRLFTTLRDCLPSARVLRYPLRGAHFILDTDASNTGLSRVLSRVQDDIDWVIAYSSTRLRRA